MCFKVTGFSSLLGYIVILMNAGASNANHSLRSDCTLVTNESGKGEKTVIFHPFTEASPFIPFHLKFQYDSIMP